MRIIDRRRLPLAKLLLIAVACTLLAPKRSFGISLTGVAIYAADETGEPAGPFWHTSLDPSGRPIAVTRWLPTGLRGIPFLNDSDGSISVDLLPMSHITTVFFQYNLGEFSQWMVLNLFFNGDNLNPGISALIPFERGFTLFTTNPDSSALSLYGRAVQNPQSLIYDDGSSSARVGVAFYFRSGDPRDEWMWRPSDLANLDRVGPTSIEPDGQWDGILVFELVVGPSQQPMPGSATSNMTGSRPGVGPLTAQVGQDLWPTPQGVLPAQDQGGAAGAESQDNDIRPTATGPMLGTTASPPPPTPTPAYGGSPTPRRNQTPNHVSSPRTESPAPDASPTAGKKAGTWW